MKILEMQFKKQGFTYDLVERSKNHAIHSQKCNDSGRLVAYEVCRINKNEERVISGVTIAASESVASNEQFGTSAWCYSLSGSTQERALQRAKDKFAELEAAQIERERLAREKEAAQ